MHPISFEDLTLSDLTLESDLWRSCITPQVTFYMGIKASESSDRCRGEDQAKLLLLLLRVPLSALASPQSSQQQEADSTSAVTVHGPISWLELLRHTHRSSSADSAVGTVASSQGMEKTLVGCNSWNCHTEFLWRSFVRVVSDLKALEKFILYDLIWLFHL